MKQTIVNPIIKNTLTFLQTSAGSGGKITEFETSLQPGGGNLVHCHPYPEKFTAMDGELGLKLGNRERRFLKPGESYTVEPMAAHGFFNPGEREIRFAVQVKPGHQGFEYFLRIVYGLAADGLVDKESKPKSIKHAAILLCMADVRIPGFLTLIFPILKRVAARARANGVEQELIARYCT